MTVGLIIQFLFLTAIISGAIIFTLHRVFISSVEGAKQRLERDAEAARTKEVELNRKIKQADEELAARKKELDQIEQKMKLDLEAAANKHREELVTKARADAEEIIVKAQNAADGVRRDIEKQMELKIIDHAVSILAVVLSKRAKVALEKDLVDEFIEQLKNVDMSKISLDIKKAEVVTSCAIADADLKRIAEIIKSKAGRDIALTSKVDGAHICGVVIQFGSLLLDGSMKTAVKDSALALKAETEKVYQKK
ncbi:MAG: F0F1 ATP synthase subunit delta [Candidatus Omnitrophica bacterium]|nr:F0F1 ATP synthase subunit delta [Candidatus Omnitrophota bacterium]